jgi:hypothetical protein
MLRKVALTVGAAAVLTVLATTAASAYPDAGSVSKCSSGASGAACAHLETDAGSGHIRARAAATPAAGSSITIVESRLDVLTTERATGEQQAAILLETKPAGGKVVTSGTGNLIAGPAEEQCDSKLAIFQYRAIMVYKTRLGQFTLNTGWTAGRC